MSQDKANKSIDDPSDKTEEDIKPTDESEVVEQSKVAENPANSIIMVEKSELVAEPAKESAKELEKPERATDPLVSNGFKVIIHYSVVPLPDDHPIRRAHKTLEEFVSPEGNRYYMIPGFDSDVTAQDAIDAKYKKQYPGAYVAAFLDGKRVY